MSQIRVNDIVNVSGTGPISVSLGASVPPGKVISGAGGLNLTGISTVEILRSNNTIISGVITATTFSGSGSGLTDITIYGSGEFNPGISSSVAFSPTTTLSTAYTAPSTASTRQIVHSVSIANTAASTRYVTATMYSGNISIGNSMPIPAGTTIELLQQPKVLLPSEVIKIQADANDSLQAVVTTEQKNQDTTFFGSGVGITTSATYTDLYTATSNCVIQSILLVNTSENSDTRVRVVWTDGSLNTNAFFVYNMILPYKSSVEVLEKPKFLPNGHKIRVYADNADRASALISGKTL